MLKFLFGPTAPMARAIFGLAAPWMCAWLVLSPVALAAEAKPAPEPARTTPPPPFDSYQPWRDEPLSDWREVNDRVGEVGGWRTYLREAQQGEGSADPGRHQH